MSNKIRVYGKAQNRTALGIVKAYLVLHPNATLDELRQAFPNGIAPDKGVKENFIDINEVRDAQGDSWNGYFVKPDELLSLADGTQVAFNMMWTAPSLGRLVTKAAEYEIETGVYDASMKSLLTAGYRLEYINGFDPNPKPKKKGCLGLFALIVLFTVAAAAGMAAIL